MDMLGSRSIFSRFSHGLAIGIVVDDAIMVLENIVRHFHMGKTGEAGRAGRRAGKSALPRQRRPSRSSASLSRSAGQRIIGVFLFQFGMTISTAVDSPLLEAITSRSSAALQI